MAYHLPLIILFSLRRVTGNVWGGCMLLPLAALRGHQAFLLQVRLIHVAVVYGRVHVWPTLLMSVGACPARECH